MKSGLSALVLLALIATPAVAYQLSPAPEAGLWRSENRIVVGTTNRLQALDEAAKRLSYASPAEHRALLSHAIKEATPTVSMECLTPLQVMELVQIEGLQREIQRKVPECELNVHPVDRSTLNLYGQCHASHGFHGEMRGHMEFISSHEFQASFLGEGRMLVDPHNSESRTQEVSIQRTEVFRWSAADCGEVAPQERLSF